MAESTEYKQVYCGKFVYPTAEKIYNRIDKAVTKYAERWIRNEKAEFRRAGWMILHHTNRLRVLAENVPEEFAGSWRWVMDARDIEIVHRVLTEAKEADDAEETG